MRKVRLTTGQKEQGRCDREKKTFVAGYRPWEGHQLNLLARKRGLLREKREERQGGEKDWCRRGGGGGGWGWGLGGWGRVGGGVAGRGGGCGGVGGVGGGGGGGGGCGGWRGGGVFKKKGIKNAAPSREGVPNFHQIISFSRGAKIEGPSRKDSRYRGVLHEGKSHGKRNLFRRGKTLR